MGIMNYHCFNKLRESCPVQTPNPQIKMSPTVCAEPLLSLMFVLANFLLSPLLDPAIPSCDGKRILRSRLRDLYPTQFFGTTTPNQRITLNSNIGCRLRLGYADGLAGHEAAVDHEQNHGRMELESRTLEPDTKGKIVMNPTLREPIGHDGVHAERSGNGSSFEILALASGVLWKNRNGNIEAGEAGEATQNEEGKTNSVGQRTKTKGEGDHSGSDTEGDLNSITISGHNK